MKPILVSIALVPVGSQVYWAGERWQVLPGLDLGSLENCIDCQLSPEHMVVVIEEAGQ